MELDWLVNTDGEESSVATELKPFGFFKPTIETRELALTYFAKAVGLSGNQTVGDLEGISTNLLKAAEAFNKCWIGKTVSFVLPSDGLFSDTAFAAKSNPAFVNAIRDTLLKSWDSDSKAIRLSRGLLIVLELCVVALADKSSDQLSENGLLLEFCDNGAFGFMHDRADSILKYRRWKNPMEQPNDDESKRWKKAASPLDYCGAMKRSVCTPVLLGHRGLANGEIVDEGQVMWLTIDLFEDGIGLFTPDIFSLGWTLIAPSNGDGNGGEANLQQDDERGILKSFDDMWALSGLAQQGFSGRWRITNQPTMVCEASRLELENKANYNSNLSGRSAECATLVALLAAAGLCYSDSNLAEPGEREMLNPKFAVTGTVEAGNAEQPLSLEQLRELTIGQVYMVDRKTGAASRYRLEVRDDHAPLIDTILVATDDKDTAQEAETQRSSEENYRGVYFEACNTVGESLEWMLSVNELKRDMFKGVKKAWEDRWGWARDEHGRIVDRNNKPIAIIRDDQLFQINEAGDGPRLQNDQPVVQDPADTEFLAQVVNTGSLEYMQTLYKELPGAVEPHTPEPDEANVPSSVDEIDGHE